MNRTEQSERQAAAARLKQARLASKLGGYRKLHKRFGWNENTYKAHETGQNGFGIADAKRYAKEFKVSVAWLMSGDGSPTDIDEGQNVGVTSVPLVPWISAGQLSVHEGVMDFSDFTPIAAVDLPAGEWVAFRVDGDSMNKISPPDSIIFANLRDRQLVANGCYVVADEAGGATYKRYRPNESPPFQPASYNDISPPKFDGEVKIIGRVRRSIIDM